MGMPGVADRDTGASTCCGHCGHRPAPPSFGTGSVASVMQGASEADEVGGADLPNASLCTLLCRTPHDVFLAEICLDRLIFRDQSPLVASLSFLKVQPRGVELNEEDKSTRENTILKQVWVIYVKDEFELVKLIRTKAGFS